jgi:hypothetical protein
MSVREVGLLGRLPGKMPAGLKTLDYYVAGPLPPAPVELTPPTPEYGQWGMLGNTNKGNCGVAGCEHVFMADAAVTHEHQEFPDATECVAYYLKYTGGVDSGVSLATFLLYVHKNTYYGKTVGAYAPVHVTDIKTLRFATFAYGATYLGIVVTQAMQQTFQSQGVWSVATLNSPVAGGHCVVGVGYDDLGPYVVTWGAIQHMSWSCWQEMTRFGDTEAFAVMTGELAARKGDDRGISYDALALDLSRL